MPSLSVFGTKVALPIIPKQPVAPKVISVLGTKISLPVPLVGQTKTITIFGKTITLPTSPSSSPSSLTAAQLAGKDPLSTAQQQSLLNTEFATFSSGPAGVLDYKPAFGPDFKDTQSYISDYLQANSRQDVPPAPILPWECRIGGAKFFVPPININVTKVFQSGSMTGAAIRQQSSPKFNTGHSETLISMTLYFPSNDTIWGFAGDKLEIDFDKTDDAVIDKFMSSLRGLVTQFRYTPFLPIKNAYLNSVWNIDGVAMQGLTISSLADYPFCLVANLQMVAFNHKVYLPMVEHLEDAMHWGRFRQYVGRAAVKLESAANQNFLLINSAPTAPIIPNSPNDPNFAGNALTLPPNTLDDPNQGIVNYDKLSEYGAAPNIDFYFPDHDPARFVLPELQGFAAIKDKNYGSVSWWQSVLGVIGLDVGSYGGFQDIVRYPNAQQMNELALLKIYLHQANITPQQMSSAERDKYISSRVKDLVGSNPTQKQSDLMTREASAAWYGTIYQSYLDNPALQAFFAFQQYLRGTTQIKEWEVPMRKLNINQNNVLVTDVTVSMGNNLARLQLNMIEEPTYQHIGGLDTNITITMRVRGEDDLNGIRQMFEIINGLARLEHSHAVLGFLGIKNIITALCGTKYVLPHGFEVNSVPGYPHVYDVVLSFLDFDVFQQKRELLSSEQETEFIQAFGKRNPFLRIKQLWGAFNAYPDFPLSVRDKDGRILGHLDPDYYFRAYNSIDTDLVEGYKIPIPAPPPPPPAPSSIAGIPEFGAPIPTTSAVTKVLNDQLGTKILQELGTTIHNRIASDYPILHHFGPLAQDLTPISVGIHAEGMDLRHGNDTHAMNMKIDEPHAGNMRFDTFTPGATPPALYSLPHFQEDGTATNKGDPQHNFGLMMKDTQHRDKSGRMVRAFPTYMLWLIDEGGVFAGMKLFDNFYGLQSVIDFSLQDSEDVLATTLVLKISNLYSRLSTAYADLVDPHLFPKMAALINNQLNQARNMASGLDPDFLVKLDTINLQPGVRLHLRLGYCVDDLTEILTTDGWKTHDRLNQNDIVLTLNHETGLSEWQPVSAVNKFWVDDEDMILIDGKKHSSLTTLGHRWPVIHNISKTDNKAKTSRLVRRERWWKTSETLKTNDKLIAAAPCLDVPTEMKYSDAFVEVVAWFWTEGHIHGKVHKNITISQSRVKNPENIERIRKTLTQLFGPSSSLGIGGRTANNIPLWRERERPNRDETEFRLNAAAAKLILEVSPNKVTELKFIQLLTIAQLELFIDISLRGDGHDITRQKRSTEYISQKAPEHLDAIELASILVGYRTHRYTNPYLLSTKTDNYNMSCLSLSKSTTFAFTDYKPQRIKYTGITWCPTTPNGTWMARRNGHAYFTGNSANPNLLETVFNGTITEVEQGDIITVTAQSDAIELGAIINNVNSNGSSGRIDGCLPYRASLPLWGGGKVEIGKVIKDKLTPTLIGMDDNGRIVPCEVTGWYNNGVKEQWLNIKAESPARTRRGLSESIRITPNHHIFINGQFKAAQYAQVGDSITRFTEEPSGAVVHLIRSSLLGDGSVCETANKSKAKFSESHVDYHSEYTAYIEKWLGICRIKTRRIISGYGSQMDQVCTASYVVLQRLREEWYPEGIKIVPQDLSWVDDFTIAKWYMDDGSLTSIGAANFATNGFTKEDVNRLGSLLTERYGVNCYIYYSKGWCLRANKTSGLIHNFWKAIAPHIVLALRYKLPQEYQEITYQDYEIGSHQLVSWEGRITSIESVSPFRERIGFDITTTSHNYFARGFLVHNSLMTGFWMSEPRDLMVRLLSMGASTFKEVLAHATRGTIYSENKYGIRHFGNMMYEPMTANEQSLIDAYKASLAGKLPLQESFIATGGPGGPAGVISGGIAHLVGQMWVNFTAKRDYEVFKRNIYPGNGSGIAQYQGGDWGDGGIATAMTPPGVTADGTPQTASPNPLDILKAAKAVDPPTASPGEQLFQHLKSEIRDPAQIAVVNNIQNKVIGGFLGGFSSTAHGFSKILGLESEVTNDVPGGYFGPNAEVSFRAQTYMKTVWDMFQVCAALLPNYIVAVRPFENRSTVFYGKPHWAYTSGVIPLSTGINEEAAPKQTGPDAENQKIMQQIEKAMAERKVADTPQTLYDQLATLDPSQLTGQDPAVLATGAVGGDPNASTGGLNYTGGTPLVGSSNIQQAYNYLVGKGLTTSQASGIIGNLISESGVNPNSIQSGGPGRGIAQWSVDGRWVNLLNLASSTKRSSTDLGLQLDYLWQELNGSYARVLTQLKATTSVESATIVIGQQYEIFAGSSNAGGPNMLTRIGNAKGVLAKYGATAVQTTGSAGIIGGSYSIPDKAPPSPPLSSSSRAGVPPSLGSSAVPTPTADLNKIPWLKDKSMDPETYSLKFGSQDTIPVDFTGQQGLKDVIGHGASQVYSGFRSSSEADDIWGEFRKYFPDDAKKTFDDQYPKNKDKYIEIIQDYMTWMWDNAYQRGWVVSTADVIIDTNPISGVLSEVGLKGVAGNVINDVASTIQTVTNFITNPFGGISQAARVYHFDRAIKMFKVYITQGPGAATIDPSQPNSGKGAIQWMLANASAGFSHKSIIGRGLEIFKKNVWDNLYKIFADPVKAIGSTLVGIVNVVRSSIMQLNQGLSMSGFSGKQANLLNAMYNDSVYYDSKLIPGSLMWQADNCFTREYGEPVVEIRQPFQRMHYINSFQHILSNGIIETMDGVVTVVTATSNGKNPKTVYFDKGAPTDRQIEKVVDTGLLWDEPKGFLGGVRHPIQMLRSFSTHFNNGDSATDAVRCARTALKQSLQNIYSGEILVLGDPSIRPYDLVYIADTYEKISGMFEVEQVIHHFTPEMGFVTSITPNAIVMVNDPAKWQFGSIFQRQWAVQNLRNSLRRSFANRSAAEASVGVKDTLDPKVLVSQSMTEIQATTQFTGGASALVKDIGGAAGVMGIAGVVAGGPIGIAADVLGWKAFGWVRDNILDVHACYIQYLNRNGKPMDSGLSYNHGVAVGQLHVWSGLSSALGIQIPINIDGQSRITSDLLLQNLGWDEQAIQTVVEKDIDMWTQQTRANILQMTQRNQETPPLINPMVQMATVTGIIDANTLAISPYGPGPFTGIGMVKIAYIIQPSTISFASGAAPQLTQLDPSIAGAGPINYMLSIFGTGGQLEQAGYKPTVALRANPEHPTDPKNSGLLVASVFFRVPDGTGPAVRESVLLTSAQSYPAVTWDSYLADGNPYTLNWELVIKGFSTVDTGMLSKSIPGQGVSGG